MWLLQAIPFMLVNMKEDLLETLPSHINLRDIRKISRQDKINNFIFIALHSDIVF